MTSQLHDIIRAMLCVLSVTASVYPTRAAAGDPTVSMSQWNGEQFEKNQGGFYFAIALKGFKAEPRQAPITGAVRVSVSSLLKHKTYVLAQDQADPLAAPRQIWRLPVGKYSLDEVTLVDASGGKRTWLPKPRASFIIRRQSLSNLGLWTLSPAPLSAAAMIGKLTAVDNRYRERGRAFDSSVAAVIDGFTGLEQERFAGNKAALDAQTDKANARELRIATTFTREVSMFFKLDLFKFNYHAQAVATVLSVMDPKLRMCYTDRLDVRGDLKGEVKFTFLLSKETATMAKLKHTGGSADDAKLVECLYYQLLQASFPVPENMIGELTYSFQAR